MGGLWGPWVEWGPKDGPSLPGLPGASEKWVMWTQGQLGSSGGSCSHPFICASVPYDSLEHSVSEIYGLFIPVLSIAYFNWLLFLEGLSLNLMQIFLGVIV